MARNWIKSATANSHGQFRRKAESAGETTRQFASEHAGDGGKLGAQARLAKNLMGMHAEGGVVEGHAKGGEVKHVAKKHKFRKPAPKSAPPVPPEQTATDVAPAAMPAAMPAQGAPMPAQATGGAVDRVASMSRASRMYGAKKVRKA